MKPVTIALIAALLLVVAGGVVLGLGLLDQREVEAYNRTFQTTPPQTMNITLTEGSLLSLTGTEGTQYCPWYVHRNAMLNLGGVKDLTISDSRTVLQIDGRNILNKNLLAMDDPALVNNPRRLQAVFDPRCQRPLRANNVKLSPLWGK